MTPRTIIHFHSWRLSTCALLFWLVASAARAEAPLCDSEWGEQSLTIGLGSHPADGQPLKAYDFTKPFEPYELLGDHYLFAEKGRIYRMVGQFTNDEAGDKEGTEALTKVYGMSHLYTGANKPFLTTLGPYLVSEAPLCKVDRSNPIINSSAWILDKDKGMLVATNTECKSGRFTKRLTLVSCDGKKNLMTDSVSAPCEARRVRTCIHTLAPGVLLFDHHYSSPGSGTSVLVRVYDVKKKKKLKSVDWVNDGGPETEIMSVEDIDKDGVAEIVRSIAGSGQATSVLKWRQGRFSEVK